MAVKLNRKQQLKKQGLSLNFLKLQTFEDSITNFLSYIHLGCIVMYFFQYQNSLLLEFFFPLSQLFIFLWLIHVERGSCSPPQYTTLQTTCFFSKKILRNALSNIEYLVSSQLDGDCNIDGVVNYTHHWSDQWNEEKGKPDDADQKDDNESTHAVFHYFLLLLSFRLWVFLRVECIQINIFCILKLDKTTLFSISSVCTAT